MGFWKDYFSKHLAEIKTEVKASARMGAKDLHNAIVPAFPDSVRGVDEPGNVLSPTSQIVTEDLKSYEREMQGYGGRAREDQEREIER